MSNGTINMRIRVADEPDVCVAHTAEEDFVELWIDLEGDGPSPITFLNKTEIEQLILALQAQMAAMP